MCLLDGGKPKKHVVGSSTDLQSVVWVVGIHFGAVTEKIAVLVASRGKVVVQANGIDTHRGKRVQFFRLADSIVIRVYPEAEGRKNGIAGINDSITIPSVYGLIVNRQSKEAVGARGWRLRRKVSEKLGSVVDDAVTIAVQG